MRFYTSVYEKFNKILVRGYENGEYFQREEDFFPTFFVKSKKESKYKTLDGLYVEPIRPGKISECKEFLKKYSTVEGFKVYGNENFKAQYISDNYFEDEIKFDIKKIRVFTIDIEVSAESGFPNVFDCAEEMLTITLQLCNKENCLLW